MSKLNSKTLTIAAVVLLVLALLFVATPLLRVSGVTGRTGFNRQSDGQNLPGGQNGFGFPSQGNGTQGQDFTGPNSGTQNPGTTTNPARQFTGGGSSLLRLSFLSGISGTIVYAIALLVALAAAVGMFLTKRWGQILGIVMAVIYLLLSLVSFLPQFILGFTRGLNVLSLGLGILHLVLAMAVIILAVIPAKKELTAPAPATANPLPNARA
jgi:ABC-type glycerol-3-phosphate transport system permease component